jgi:type I restriction enzyme S subunit
MTDLPEGWQWSTVGHVTSVQLGRQRSPKNHNGPHMRPYLRSANVTWKGIDVTDVNQMNFDPDEARTFELVDGDILLNEASGSPKEVGKPAIWRGEVPGACFQNTLLRVRSHGPDYKYLFWFFFASAYSGRFGEAGRGVNIRHLGKQGLTSFPIPVPPLPEQRRIVAAIEEQFSRLDAAEASLVDAARRARILETSVLTNAFAANRNSAWSTVGNVASVDLGRQRSPENHDGPHMTPYLRSANVTWTGINTSDVKTMNFDPGDAEKFALRDGDILLNEASGSPNEVGKPAIWRDEIPGACFQNTLLRVRSDGPVMEYLYWYFFAMARAGRFGEAGRGVNIRHLGKRGLVDFPIPVPTLDEQREVIALIEEATSRSDALGEELSRAMMMSTALRRSILTAAFSGRLAMQDPTDEPALELLERIAAELAASKLTRRKKTAAS